MAPVPALPPRRNTRPRREVLATASAALLAFAIFLASPVHYVADSHYSLLLSESLYRHGTGALNRYFAFPLDPARHPGLPPVDEAARAPSRARLPYLLEVVDKPIGISFGSPDGEHRGRGFGRRHRGS